MQKEGDTRVEGGPPCQWSRWSGMKWRDEGPFVSVSPIPRSHPSIRVREEREKKGKRHIVLFNHHSTHTYWTELLFYYHQKKPKPVSSSLPCQPQTL